MKILVTGAFDGFEELKQVFSGDDFVFVKDESAPLSIDKSSIDYVICNGLFLYHNIEDFTSLKYVQVTSAGLDRLPKEYIEKNNIKVFNARGVYSVPIAEWVICKLLDVYKKSFELFEKQEKHLWEKERDIEELTGKTVTIVGYGNIGQEIARRLKSFGCNVVGVDKVLPNSASQDTIVDICDLEKYIAVSDIIILTLPLTNETKHLFGESIFKGITNSPILVNVARGQIIKTSDLIEYGDRFRAIILDVFEDEPLEGNNELWGMKNIIITPHNSFISNRNNERLYEVVTNNLRSVINE